MACWGSTAQVSPAWLRLKHIMDARIHAGAGATMQYRESHYHGPYGGIEVLPKAQVTVDAGGRFFTSFSLVLGRVGQLVFDYDVAVAEHGVAELSTKAYGQADDHLRVNETLHLNGEGARGLTKTRLAVRDAATSEVCTTAEGNAPMARGHMDCTEIVRGQAVARNTPIVVDLGMVKQIEITDGYVTVRLVLTAPGCPLAGWIALQAQRAVAALPGVAGVQVDLLDEPWQPPDAHEGWQSWVNRALGRR